MSEPLFEVRDVVKRYEKEGREITVLDKVNLSIGLGDFVVIVGATGSGKTTLINILSGLDKPDSGKVYFEGEDMTRMSEEELADLRRENMGFVFQHFNLIPEFTALENVESPLYPTKLSDREIRTRALKVLELVGMTHRVNHYPDELSGGEKQKIAIARALITNPVVIFADEPTAALDPQSEKEVIWLLREINRKRRTTIILATHNRALASSTDKVFELKNGKLVRVSGGRT
ncbi:MAG: ABC transporter ATP-binding protein [Candidatus Baldrarchaeia archaeon]